MSTFEMLTIIPRLPVSVVENMKTSKIDGIFLDALKSRIPQKKKLVNKLIDILKIEREAIYRRLRGEVPFTFAEVSAISRNLSLYLDNMIGMELDTEKVRPCRLTFMEYLNPGKVDYAILDAFIYSIKRMKHWPESEACTATNSLPQLLYVNYESIYNFYLFKWKFQQGGLESRIKYADINPPKEMQLINKHFQQELKWAENVTIILDKYTFRMLVDDIQYFSDINLISKNEVQTLKEELFYFLDDMEELTIKGAFETGKKVHIYIQHIY